jgi:hypothetical protein
LCSVPVSLTLSTDKSQQIEEILIQEFSTRNRKQAHMERSQERPNLEPDTLSASLLAGKRPTKLGSSILWNGQTYDLDGVAPGFDYLAEKHQAGLGLFEVYLEVELFKVKSIAFNLSFLSADLSFLGPQTRLILVRKTVRKTVSSWSARPSHLGPQDVSPDGDRTATRRRPDGDRTATGRRPDGDQTATGRRPDWRPDGDQTAARRLTGRRPDVRKTVRKTIRPSPINEGVSIHQH